MEEVLPPQTAGGAGYSPTRVRQFTIFLENRVGRLSALVRTLEQNVERINAISIEESADAALVRIIISNPDAGKIAMKREGFSFSESEVIAVEIPESHEQPLLSICSCLLAAEINIHYAYPLLICPGGPALALYVDDPTLAARILIRKGYKIVSEGDLRV